jgi:hypothetical protein
MGNSRIPENVTGWKIPWKKIHGVTTMGQQHQDRLLVAAEHKGMENTSRGWGYLGANCRRGINGEENYQPVFLGPSVRIQGGRGLHSIYSTNYSHGFFNNSGYEHKTNEF